MSDGFLPGIDGPATRTASKSSVWPWISLAVVLVVIVALVYFAFANDDPNEYDANNSREAIAQCEDAISERLKAPSTAEFDSSATGSGTWTVTGTVDAENSFGAMIRSRYECSVIIDSEDGSARVRIDSFE